MAIFREPDLVKFSELFSVNFDELRHPSLEGRGTACGGGVPLEAPQAVELSWKLGASS